MNGALPRREMKGAGLCRPPLDQAIFRSLIASKLTTPPPTRFVV